MTSRLMRVEMCLLEISPFLVLACGHLHAMGAQEPMGPFPTNGGTITDPMRGERGLAGRVSGQARGGGNGGPQIELDGLRPVRIWMVSPRESKPLYKTGSQFSLDRRGRHDN